MSTREHFKTSVKATSNSKKKLAKAQRDQFDLRIEELSVNIGEGFNRVRPRIKEESSTELENFETHMDALREALSKLYEISGKPESDAVSPPRIEREPRPYTRIQNGARLNGWGARLSEKFRMWASAPIEKTGGVLEVDWEELMGRRATPEEMEELKVTVANAIATVLKNGGKHP